MLLHVGGTDFEKAAHCRFLHGLSQSLQAISMPISSQRGFALLHCIKYDSPVTFGAMKSFAQMMGTVLKQTGSAGALMPIWTQLVGEVVAKHTRPVRWEGQTLIIRCDADAWRQALEAERSSLAKKLASALGETAVPNIVLEVS